MWSPASPLCLGKMDYIAKHADIVFLSPVVDCGPPTDPTNGQVDTSSGTTFGSTATYTCDTGYTLSGSQSRTCIASGKWTLPQSQCIGKLL